jgi:hypothetical protein
MNSKHADDDTEYHQREMKRLLKNMKKMEKKMSILRPKKEKIEVKKVEN